MTIPTLIYTIARYRALVHWLTVALEKRSRMIDTIDPWTGRVTAVCGCCGREAT